MNVKLKKGSQLKCTKVEAPSPALTVVKPRSYPSGVFNYVKIEFFLPRIPDQKPESDPVWFRRRFGDGMYRLGDLRYGFFYWSGELRQQFIGMQPGSHQVGLSPFASAQKYCWLPVGLKACVDIVEE